MTDIFIHANADGTYQGNGGFIMLNELGVQLGRMGYAVRWFDHLDRFVPSMWDWTGYNVPHLASFATVQRQDAPIVTTWLYNWLDTLTQLPALFPRLRYWCSGELLRDEPRYDPSRAFVREHIGEIAINNPSLANVYKTLNIIPRWNWTNWVRDLFKPDSEQREYNLIGYQPDGNDYIGEQLRERFGADNVLACVGSHPDVALKMQRCDLFLAWNKHWSLICGGGESFGLNAFEAMACGCFTIARRHCGNDFLLSGTAHLINQQENIGSIMRLYMGHDAKALDFQRQLQFHVIEERFRFDYARRAAIQGYLNA
jgi:hypothetical protein